MQNTVKKKSRTILSVSSTKASLPLDTSELFRGTAEVAIKHRGDTYRLRITRQGKLILTK